MFLIDISKLISNSTNLYYDFQIWYILVYALGIVFNESFCCTFCVGVEMRI